jgi:hypothetical protein
MSIADTWSEDAFVRLMQDMLKQQNEDAEDVPDDDRQNRD